MKPLTFAIALLAALPAPVLAQHPGKDVRGSEARVSYADLNLRTQAGRQMLDRRIARAVNSVCFDTSGSVDMARKMAVRRCVVETQAQVEPQRDRILAAGGMPADYAGRTR